MNLITTVVCGSVLLAFIVQLWRNIIIVEQPVNSREYDTLLFMERMFGTIAKASSVVWFVALLVR